MAHAVRERKDSASKTGWTFQDMITRSIFISQCAVVTFVRFLMILQLLRNQKSKAMVGQDAQAARLWKAPRYAALNLATITPQRIFERHSRKHTIMTLPGVYENSSCSGRRFRKQKEQHQRFLLFGVMAYLRMNFESRREVP